jgi:polyphosphate kinase 2 (PPK2 family)
MPKMTLAKVASPKRETPTSNIYVTNTNLIAYYRSKITSSLEAKESDFLSIMAASSENQYPWKQPAKPVKRGAFIVIEGLDRAGKTTQVKKLCDTLYSAGHNLTTIRFPGKPKVKSHTPDCWFLSPTNIDQLM